MISEAHPVASNNLPNEPVPADDPSLGAILGTFLALPISNLRLDGGTQPRATLDWVVIEEYAEAMRDGARFPAVTAVYDGMAYWLVDGFHRVNAAQRAGLATIAADVKPGTLQDAQWLSYGVNAAHGLRRTNEDKRRAVEAALVHPKAGPLPDNQIAQHCGVSQPFVSKLRLSYNDYKINEPAERVVTRGDSTYTMNTAKIGSAGARQSSQDTDPLGQDLTYDLPPWNRDAGWTLHRLPAGPYRADHDTLGSIVMMDIVRLNMEMKRRTSGEPSLQVESEATPAAVYEPESPDRHYTVMGEGGYEETLTVAPDEEIAVLKRPHVAQNSGENEWYTPAEYIAAARAVMGRIDLDPASTEVANAVVGASKFYTKEDDGLLYDWHGKVWMNPPYAQPYITYFVEGLREEYEAGRVTEAIVLVNNATETAWFRNLMCSARAVCFPCGRVKFWSPDRIAAPLQGQAVVYLGPQPKEFIKEFQRLGWCAEVAV